MGCGRRACRRLFWVVLTLYYVLSHIQKEMHRLHTETTRSSDYLLKTVLLLYILRPDAARVAGYVTTRSRSVRTTNQTPHARRYRIYFE